MSEMPLGKKLLQPRKYDPLILFPIPRKTRNIELYGYDLWRAYELIWLNQKGKPTAGILEIVYPSQSKCIVESKSLKLYLGGLSYAKFDKKSDVVETIRADLGNILHTTWISVRIIEQDDFAQIINKPHPYGDCLDNLDMPIEVYQRDPDLLACSQVKTEETLYTDLFRTNCPITGQPDWASVEIRYKGNMIHKDALLRYLCSYRDYQGFAEEICEQIFADIKNKCSPETIIVKCFYTRRGGIDITPVRCSRQISIGDIDRTRLIRQ